ncbi:RIP metalloprotease RseP [Candidatus Marinamargulisbacteria bacterium SCGC AG-414-C22]|nr:RIP metalloprotease RseP [Candidatus Marinamargulisbacteria bacterium SCGC AG-414-C22]
MGLIFALLTLGFLIFIHELGHLIAARASGMAVHEFAIGFGPKIITKEWKGIMYSLRLFPIGGFVKIAGIEELVGLEPEDDSVKESEKFSNKSWLAKFCTLSAGCFMNFMLAFFIFFIMSTFIGLPTVTNVIEKVMPQSPAELSGIKPADKIISINGRQVKDWNTDLVSVIQQAQEGESLSVLVHRGADQKLINIVPSFDTEKNIPVIGVIPKQNFVKMTVLSGIGHAAKSCITSVYYIGYSLKMLISGEAKMKDLGGPVLIVQLLSKSVTHNMLAYLQILALLSINLALLNLLPIPALDGGHILFLIVEALFKRPVSEKFRLTVSNISMACLLLFIVYTIFNDIRFWAERTTYLGSLQ